MKVLSFFILLSIFINCSPKTQQTMNQGIKGQIVWLAGNQMPGPGKKMDTQKGIRRQLFIHELTNMSSVVGNAPLYSNINTTLVTSTWTDEHGQFSVDLPAGDYSIFVKEEGGFFASVQDGKGNFNAHTVNEGQYIETIIRVDYQAAY